MIYSDGAAMTDEELDALKDVERMRNEIQEWHRAVIKRWPVDWAFDPTRGPEALIAEIVTLLGSQETRAWECDGGCGAMFRGRDRKRGAIPDCGGDPQYDHGCNGKFVPLVRGKA